MANLETETITATQDEQQVDLSLLMDVPLQVTVELGRARITIENLLRLSQGAIVELSQVIGEPLAIFVNNKLIAHGSLLAVEMTPICS